MGKCRGDLRLPLTPMAEPNVQGLKNVMSEFNLM